MSPVILAAFLVATAAIVAAKPQQLGDNRDMPLEKMTVKWESPTQAQLSECAASETPLRCYFDAVASGPGVWKWRHC